MANSRAPGCTEQPQYLGFTASELFDRGSLSTAKEIVQQPRVWREVLSMVKSRRDEIDTWLQPNLAKEGLRIVLCGAGTSAFIGDSIAAWLRRELARYGSLYIEAVPTTDIVPDPIQFFGADIPTLMISFARSGDSPESVAAVELADQLLSDCCHLIFTCNPNGKLRHYAERDARALCLLMPEGTNDCGFAMTSSYSSMFVACIEVFSKESDHCLSAANIAESIVSTGYGLIGEIAKIQFDRLVVLGAGTMLGAARESSLKCLELAGGSLTATSDTPLGFRHGPKIVVNDRTIVVCMVSGDPSARRYDQDLINELMKDEQAISIMELSPETLVHSGRIDLPDIWLSLLYVIHCQVFAFLSSYSRGIKVDSPCPTGEVNRVVRGVTIYPYSAPND